MTSAGFVRFLIAQERHDQGDGQYKYSEEEKKGIYSNGMHPLSMSPNNGNATLIGFESGKNAFGETTDEFSAHFRFHNRSDSCAVGRWQHCERCEIDFVTEYGHEHLAWFATRQMVAISEAYHEVKSKLFDEETSARINADRIYEQIMDEATTRIAKEAAQAGQSEWSNSQRAEWKHIEHQAWLYKTVAVSPYNTRYVQAVKASKRFFGGDGLGAPAGMRVSA